MTDPTFNPVCLNSDGSPDTDPTPTDPNACAALGLQPNSSLLPGLVPYDLTRGGSLFTFGAHADIKELSAYLEDTIKLGNWTINVGVLARWANVDGECAAKASFASCGLPPH